MPAYTADEQGFINYFNDIANKAYSIALDKFGGMKAQDGTLIALMHSELSEALESFRKNLPAEHIKGFKGEEEEFADVILRIMDYAESRGLRVAEAIVEKLEFNRTREWDNEGKKF